MKQVTITLTEQEINMIEHGLLAQRNYWDKKVNTSSSNYINNEACRSISSDYMKLWSKFFNAEAEVLKQRCWVMTNVLIGTRQPKNGRKN